MHNVTFALEGALRVLVVGLIFGAGLPAVFALGVRALAYGEGGGNQATPKAPHPVGKLLAYLAFAVVVGGVLLGLTVIVASGLGKELSFDGGFPTFVDE
jgi:hypothetical protein